MDKPIFRIEAANVACGSYLTQGFVVIDTRNPFGVIVCSALTRESAQAYVDTRLAEEERILPGDPAWAKIRQACDASPPPTGDRPLFASADHAFGLGWERAMAVVKDEWRRLQATPAGRRCVAANELYGALSSFVRVYEAALSERGPDCLPESLGHAHDEAKAALGLATPVRS